MNLNDPIGKAVTSDYRLSLAERFVARMARDPIGERPRSIRDDLLRRPVDPAARLWREPMDRPLRLFSDAEDIGRQVISPITRHAERERMARNLAFGQEEPIPGRRGWVRTVRHPGWTKGAKIRLADGMPWTFPKFDGATSHHVELLKALDAATASGDAGAIILAELRLFAWMFRRNYSLPADEVRRLFSIDYSAGPDSPDMRMRAELLAAAVDDIYETVPPPKESA